MARPTCSLVRPCFGSPPTARGVQLWLAVELVAFEDQVLFLASHWGSSGAASK